MGMESLNVYIWRAGLIQRRETPPEMRGMSFAPPPWDRTLIEIFLISVVNRNKLYIRKVRIIFH